MGNPFDIIKNFLFPKQKTKIVYPANPELIERDETVRQYAEKLSSTEAQLGRYAAEEKQKQTQKIEDEQDVQLARDLSDQEKNIKNNKYEGTVSFLKIYEELLTNKKFRDSIEITDKNDIVSFGKFGDFKVLPNGYFGVTDSMGNLLSAGAELRSVIYKPESLANQLKRKRILLPYDKHGNKFPDIEEELVPECYYDEIEDKFKWTSERRVPFKDAIASREAQLSESREYIEHIEQTNIDLKNRLRDLERAKKLLDSQAEVSQTELSKAMERSIQFESKIGDMQMQVVQLTETKAINERLISGLEVVNNDLLKKTEEMGLKTDFRKALDLVQYLIAWSKNQLGKTYVQQQTVTPQEPEKKVQPGEKLN